MSDIEQLELSVEEAKKLVDRKNKANKLATNREFKSLILEGYFQEEAARLASISGDSGLIEHRGEIMDAIKGISHFRQFMQNIVRMGEVAEQDLRDAQEALDEERNTELED